MPRLPIPDIDPDYQIPNHPRFEIDGDVFKVTYDLTAEIQRQVGELIHRVNVVQDEALRDALIDLGWTPPPPGWRGGDR